MSRDHTEIQSADTTRVGRVENTLEDKVKAQRGLDTLEINNEIKTT